MTKVKSFRIRRLFDRNLSGTERLRDKIARMKYLPEDDLEGIRKLESEIKDTMKEILQKGDRTDDQRI